MTDTITERQAFLGLDEDNKDISRNIRITVEIVGRLPFFTLSQASGAGDIMQDIDNFDNMHYNVELADVIVPDIVSTECKNTLVDKDDYTRFMTVAKVASILTDVEAFLVFDSKYKDFILVPSLIEMGDSAVSQNHLAGGNYIVTGYQVGGRISTSPSKSLQAEPPMGVSDSPGFIKPPTTISTKSYLMRLNMREQRCRYNGGGVQLGDVYIETDSVPIVEVASLGPVGRVFGPDVDIHLNRLIKTEFSYYSLVSAGKGKADDILFMMPF